MAKWIYYFGNVDIHIKDDSAFITSCEHGHMEIAKWLFSKVFIDATAKHYAFVESCIRDNINIAKWLILIDVNIDNDQIFRTCCEKGSFTTAQWLYSTFDIDIHADHEYAFRHSCENGHMVITKWLHSLGNVDIPPMQ